MDINSALTQTKDAMGKAVAHVRHEFETVHTGKANPSMVENVMVEAYGTTSRLRDIAAITTPDSSTIRIQPWDKGILKDVEKAILAANIGVTPAVMGDAVRCPIPALSGERRAELAKICRDMAEQGRVAVRGIRRDIIDAVKKLQKAGTVTEDELKKFEKDVQNATDKSIADINSSLEAKEADLKKI